MRIVYLGNHDAVIVRVDGRERTVAHGQEIEVSSRVGEGLVRQSCWSAPPRKPKAVDRPDKDEVNRGA